MKILVFAGFSKSLIHFRKELLLSMVNNGHEVVAVGPENDYVKALSDIGVRFIHLEFNRMTVNPIQDIKLLINLIKLMRREKPDVYFGYTIKPVVYGSIASFLAGVENRYTMVTGLGSVFIDSNRENKIIKAIVKILYKMGFYCSDKVFFQNNDDISEFVNNKLITKGKCELINGSGVNLKHYRASPMPAENIFLFIGSLMGDKGVREYFQAASLLKKGNFDIRCWIVGPMDNRLTSITESELDEYVDSDTIEYYGSVEDVRPYLDKCRFYVLPSYREGTPRSVLEAMAKGRPIITTNAPGCKETVVDGVNGFLIPIKDSKTLADRMIWMLNNPDKAEEMAKESSRIVREKYDVNIVNHQMLKVMNLEP